MMPEKYICHGEEITPGTVIETENSETFAVSKIEFNTVYAVRTTSPIAALDITKTKAQFRKWFRENGCTVVPTT